MINQIVIDILVKRISDGWINPKTNLPLTINDILIEEYKIAVQSTITLQNEQN